MRRIFLSAVIPAIVFLLLNLFSPGCAHQRIKELSDAYGTLLDDLSLIADKQEKKGLRRAAMAGDEAFDGFMETFWLKRDPTPGTEENEYRQRFEARREVSILQLVFPGKYYPDDRRQSYLLYGTPTSMEESMHGPTVFLTWFYQPEESVLLAGHQHPLLKKLDFNYTFQLYPNIGFCITGSPERDEALRPLDDSDLRVLIELLEDEEKEPELRAAAAWRLRLDTNPQALGTLIRHVNSSETEIRKIAGAALTPLLYDAASNGIELGDFPAAIVADEDTFPRTIRSGERPRRSPDRSVDLLSSESIASLLTRVYDPETTIPSDEVTTLRSLPGAADTASISLGWLSPEEAATLFRGPLGEVRSLLDEGRGDDAHALLEPLLRRELVKIPEAWHLDALALLYTNTPGGRQLADERVRAAMRLDPGNMRYRLSLARIQYAQTLTYYTENTIDQILDEVPGLGDAYALKGQLRIEIYWGLGWRASPFAATPLDERPTTPAEFRSEAIDYLNRGLICDPDNLAAAWYLAVDQMMSREWGSLLPVMNYLIEQGIHLPEALLGKGFALQHLGRLDEAMQNYEAAMEFLPIEIRELASDPRWVLPPSKGGITSQPATALELSAAADTLEAETFWRAKDPLLTTGINERLLEQYRRFAWITWRFAVPDVGLRGWETLRGRVYLRYGEPQVIDSTHFQLHSRMSGILQVIPDDIGEAATARLYTPSETWRYGDKTFTFGGGLITGNLTFQPSSIPGSIGTTADFEKLAEEIPDSEIVVGAGEVRDMEASWYTFEDPDGNPELVAIVQLPKTPELPPFVMPAAFEPPARVVLLDEDWNQLSLDELSLPSWARSSRVLREWVTPTITFQRTDADLPRFVAIEMIPRLGDEPAFSSRDTLEIVPNQNLRLSSLVLARDVVSMRESSLWAKGIYFSREGLAILPRPDGIFHADESVYIYLEVYGLERDEFRSTRYQLALSVTGLEEQRSVFAPIVDALGRLVGRQVQEGRVTLLFDREGIQTRSFERLRVAFPEGSETGLFRVTLTVTDQVTQQRSEKTALLRIME